MKTKAQERSEQLDRLLKHFESLAEASSVGEFCLCPREVAGSFYKLKDNQFLLLYHNPGPISSALFPLKRGAIDLAYIEFESFSRHIDLRALCGLPNADSIVDGCQDDLFDLDLLDLDKRLHFSVQEELFFKKGRNVYRWQKIEGGVDLVEALKKLYPSRIFVTGPSEYLSDDQEDLIDLVLSLPAGWAKELVVAKFPNYEEILSYAHPHTSIRYLYSGSEYLISDNFRERWGIKSVCYHDDSVVCPPNFIRVNILPDPLVEGEYICLYEWLHGLRMGPCYEYLKVRVIICKDCDRHSIRKYKIKKIEIIDQHWA
jgi:hypothetical protein